MTNFLKVIKDSVKHWYLPLIVGILFVGVGFYIFATPTASYVTLAITFSLLFMFSGISDIVFAISNKDQLEGWGWNLTGGIFTFIIGVVLVRHPGITMITLPIFVGFTILFKSITAISSSLEIKKYGVSEWKSLMGIGVIGVLFSIILLWNPMFAGLSIVIWTAITFIVFGVFSIYFSIKLKKLKDVPEKISSELKDKLHKVQSEIEHAIKK